MSHRSIMPSMQWATSTARHGSLTEAVAQAADSLLAELHGREPNLILAFVSVHFAEQFTALPGLLRREFEQALLCGCLSTAVIGALEGMPRELEDQPAISLVGAILPDVQLRAMHCSHAQLPPLYAEANAWRSALNVETIPDCQLLLADSFSIALEQILPALDRHFPHSSKFGGLVSGVEHPHTPCLLLNNQVYAEGLLCLNFSGNLRVATLVAQGCRPIGEPMFANVAHDNLILQLDGKPPRQVLTALYEELPSSERELFTNALFIGLAMQTQHEYRPGDFLIRTILGLDPDSGALLLNTHPPEHCVVQLHLRDPHAAALALEQQLQRYGAQQPQPPAGALLFSCLSRGAEFFGHADHDAHTFVNRIGQTPLGGCFCNGEIGSVADHTYLQGYSSVFALFYPKQNH